VEENTGHGVIFSGTPAGAEIQAESISILALKNSLLPLNDIDLPQCPLKYLPMYVLHGPRVL